MLHRLRLMLSTIRFAHTVFALPFALLAAVMAAGGFPPWDRVVWIVLACVFARNAAMAFNRWHDAPFDRQNPRTRTWPVASGRLTRRFALGFTALNAAAFVGVAAVLGPLALGLSPVALALVLGYSTTKRWTSATHFVLGLALAAAPVGAWIAVRGTFDATPIVLGGGVFFWVAGFDLIYSCRDAAFDRRVGLHSLPVRLGLRRALAVSALCHALAVLCFLAVWAVGALGHVFLSSVAAAAWLLVYEQRLVRADDPSRADTAFFTINGWIGVLMCLGGVVDVVGWG